MSRPPKPVPCTVIIPHAGPDPFLRWTVDHIYETTPEAAVIVVQDGAQPAVELPPQARVIEPWQDRRGVGPSRDCGIMEADTDYCLLLDSHMWPHGDWAAHMVAPLKRERTAITCAVSGRRHEERGKWSEVSGYENGGRIKYLSEAMWPLEVGWRRSTTIENHTAEPKTEIQCVLGGAYGIRRSRYIDLGRPWQHAVGWGTSEQTLCLINSLMGGKQYLVTATVDHLYRNNGEILPYAQPEDRELARRMASGWYYNRLRLLDILPIPEPERQRLYRLALTYSPDGERNAGLRRDIPWMRHYAMTMMAERTADPMKALLEGLPPDAWEGYCKRWWPEIDRSVPVLPPIQPVSVTKTIHQPIRQPDTKPGRQIDVVGGGGKQWI